MTERRSFYRKIAYARRDRGAAVPARLAQHAGHDRREAGRASWPSCASEYRLGQANLGEIDPASETIKLATLGLRGVAVNLLWEKANHYKKIEDWTISRPRSSNSPSCSRTSSRSGSSRPGT